MDNVIVFRRIQAINEGSIDNTAAGYLRLVVAGGFESLYIRFTHPHLG